MKSSQALQALLADARREVVQKTRSDIEEETAYRWAARAVAAHEKYTQSRNAAWLRASDHYADEAVEHAALADPSGTVLQAVRAWFRQYVPI